MKEELFKVDYNIVSYVVHEHYVSLTIYDEGGSVSIVPCVPYETKLYSEEAFQQMYKLRDTINNMIDRMAAQNLKKRKEEENQDVS